LAAVKPQAAASRNVIPADTGFAAPSLFAGAALELVIRHQLQLRVLQSSRSAANLAIRPDRLS